MATLRDLVRMTLTGDATLMALLTGGVKDDSTVDYTGEGAKDAPRESDGVRLKPHAVINWSDSTAYDTYKVGAELESVEIYFYQDMGYSTIESAINRTKVLLHDQYLLTDDRALAHLSQTFVSRGFRAEELGNAPCRFVRFSIVHIRR